ncbi:hypothetical protein Hanom_Chr08g00700071 [Helianthus anomalus]
MPLRLRIYPQTQACWVAVCKVGSPRRLGGVEDRANHSLASCMQIFVKTLTSIPPYQQSICIEHSK